MLYSAEADGKANQAQSRCGCGGRTTYAVFYRDDAVVNAHVVVSVILLVGACSSATLVVASAPTGGTLIGKRGP